MKNSGRIMENKKSEKFREDCKIDLIYVIANSQPQASFWRLESTFQKKTKKELELRILISDKAYRRGGGGGMG